MIPSIRAQILTRSKYNRPIEGGFESWPQTITRVLDHQKWLWERALKRKLNTTEEKELSDLRWLMIARSALLAGRTLWLGGTEIARTRESSQFNCSNLTIRNVYDAVDAFWLLLQGCGVGFRPSSGTLNGFHSFIPFIKVVRSKRTRKGGNPNNVETFTDGVWTIKIGDSAEAWAKSLGKLLAGKYPARELVLDFSEIRPAGERLKGYGWMSSGDNQLAKVYPEIARIMNSRAGRHLTHIDILDITNLLGEALATRRAAELAQYEFGKPGWEDFALAKKDYFEQAPWRAQSNNSLIFWKKPTTSQIEDLFDIIVETGGSDPGLLNGEAAVRRAPWFSGVNPCGEILLPDKGFCNLCEVNVAAFGNDFPALNRAVYLIARANYRQTLVNLEDGVLQRSWHENNEFLRLCGVSLCGLVQRPDFGAWELKHLRQSAHHGANSMAIELGTQLPKNITTIKPGGTLPKIMDCTEGMSRPLGRYIANNVVFSKYDEVLPLLEASGYPIRPHPRAEDSFLVTIPQQWPTVEFSNRKGVYINDESAISQLERYRLLMDSYCDQNVSCTIYYRPDERRSIVDWLDVHWDSYVGVSFLPKHDPTLTAEDLGHPYLPQEVITKEKYDELVLQISPISLDGRGSTLEDDPCATGACPAN